MLPSMLSNTTQLDVMIGSDCIFVLAALNFTNQFYHKAMDATLGFVSLYELSLSQHYYYSLVSITIIDYYNITVSLKFFNFLIIAFNIHELLKRESVSLHFSGPKKHSLKPITLIFQIFIIITLKHAIFTILSYPMSDTCTVHVYKLCTCTCRFIHIHLLHTCICICTCIYIL